MELLVIAIFLLFQADNVRSLTPVSIREMSGLYSEERSGLADQISPNVSKLCLSALDELSKNTSQRWLLGQYIDAMGKPGSGITKGNILWLGSYASCQNIANAHYCLAAVNVTVSNKTIPVAWGLCVPSVCSETDITVGLHDTFAEIFKLLEPFTEGKVQISINTNPSAQPVNCARPSKWTTGPIVTLVICGIVALLCIAGTLLEMFVEDECWKFWVQPFRTGQPSSNGIFSRGSLSRDSGLLQSDSEGAPLLNAFPQLHDAGAAPTSVHIQQPRYKGRGFVVSFLLCFSMVRNTNKVMDTSVTPGAITCLNGVRVLSMWWVILGHTFLWMLIFRVYNDILLGINIIHRFSFQSINNAFFSVDSFFVLSGVLVAYLSFRRMEKNNGKLPLFKFYFHRFWRLTPSYMFVILFYANLIGFLGEGPLWFGNQRRTTCDQYWWTNLLYVNNFYPKQLARECLNWSWYLANDMQFYIISPVLIFVIYRFAWMGVAVVVGGLLSASFIVSGTIIGVYKTNVLEANNIEALIEGKTNGGDYTDLVYSKPYCRIAPYLVGIALGYIIYQEKSSAKRSLLSKVPKQIVSVTGWCLAIIFGLSSVFGVYSSLREGGKPFSLAENVVYGTFSRFVWGVSLAWVIYACHKGYGSLVDKILSARYWIPLSRLTYSAYLMHPIVLTSYFGSFRDTVEYTDMSLAFYFVSVTVMSYAAAFILAVCVEFPMMQLESVLFFRA